MVVSALNDNLDYEFQIEAKNNEGVIKSHLVFREKCCPSIIVHPNPALNTLTVQSENTTALKEVTLFNNLDPNITLHRQIENDVTQNISLDISTFPQGTYLLIVIDLQGCSKVLPVVIILED